MGEILLLTSGEQPGYGWKTPTLPVGRKQETTRVLLIVCLTNNFSFLELLFLTSLSLEHLHVLFWTHASPSRNFRESEEVFVLTVILISCDVFIWTLDLITICVRADVAQKAGLVTERLQVQILSKQQ